MATKKALLIGINYTNSSVQLSGCINDCIQWWSILQDVYGFDEKDIVFLRDDKSDFRPTRQRILTELTNLVNSRSTYSFICYSGHGTSMPDMNRDEADSVDECIVPSDYQTAGLIKDDDLNAILKNNVSTTIAIFDSCRSGTVLDLGNNGINTTTTPPNTVVPSGKILCFSGCKDDQNSAEVYNLNNKLPQGALTISLIYSLRKLKYYPKLNDLLSSITTDLQSGGLTQVPQISSTFPLYTDTPFPFETSQNQPTILLSENNTLRSQVTQLTSDKTQLQTQVTQLTSDKTQLQSQVTQLTSDKTQLQTQVTQLTSDKTQLQTQVTQLNTQSSQGIQNAQKIAQLQAQVTQLTTQNNASKAQVTQLTTQNNASKTQVTQLQGQISQLNTQIAQLRTQNMQLTTQINVLKRK